MKGSISALMAMAPAAAIAGCSTSYDGHFGLRTPNVTDFTPQSISSGGPYPSCNLPDITLKNSVLTDSKNRIGNIVANNQFQFDPKPGQNGALNVDGWSVCDDGKLALNGDSTFYACLSGAFYNLYNKNIAPQCHEVYFVITPCDSGNSASASASATGDGQVTANTASSSTSFSLLPTGTAGHSSVVLPSVIPPYPVGNTTTAGVTTGSGSSPTTTPLSPGSGSGSEGGSSPKPIGVTLPNGSTCPACTACAPTVTVTSTVTAGATPAGSSSTPTGGSSPEGSSSPNSPAQASPVYGAPSGAAGATGTGAAAPSGTSGTFSAGSPSSSPITPFKGAAAVGSRAQWGVVGAVAGLAGLMLL